MTSRKPQLPDSKSAPRVSADDGTETSRDHIQHLQDIPNIGPAMTEDLHLLQITCPQQLVLCDPWELYERLQRITRSRQDPCVLDTLISAVRYMQGAPAVPWWHYTAGRKKEMVVRQTRLTDPAEPPF